MILTGAGLLGADHDGGETVRTVELPAIEQPLPRRAGELLHRLREPQRTIVFQIRGDNRLVGELLDARDRVGSLGRFDRAAEQMAELVRPNGDDRVAERLVGIAAAQHDVVAAWRDAGHGRTLADRAAAVDDIGGRGIGKQGRQVDPRHQRVRIVGLAGERGREHVEKDLRRRDGQRRIERGDAQRLPQISYRRLRLPIEELCHRHRRRTAKPVAPQSTDEGERRAALGPGKALCAQQRQREMPGRGQPRRGQTEHAGLGQAQPPPLEQIALGARGRARCAAARGARCTRRATCARRCRRRPRRLRFDGRGRPASARLRTP